ncbi:3-phosphoserine/phosphohydroxythreonine transaminase [Secundilactobacillus folii]|uniref:Phosphoserine aminotransferase n=1 Tax=Secundilactobacillus folii TaxID=2678357 RepID=A0A7X2XU39_9LACO|nr:3-phosphoserine/phosphohydroxythreonine transaminase [Secundilactobacillus folii]MTV81641.1 3-phosphoserine/phosphohydroxythreonine transaminase [Secundilactobacillus folii]
MTVYNFAAGPATLPNEVITQIQDELPSLQGSGMSILEISHRSSMFDDIINAVQADLRDLMKIPDDYEVLFFQGGGTGQFAAVPMNLATDHHRIALLDSGHWAAKAGEEAKQLGYKVDTLATTKATHYDRLPALTMTMPDDTYDYLHICTNNTIEGTAYHELPKTNHVPLVADMSSNIMAQKYDVADFDLIFAGVQKNLGPAGVTIVIVKKSLIKEVDGIPSVFNYQLFAKKNSMPNTPPVFNIYATGLTLKWLKKVGGIDEMQARNQKKASLLYDFLDQSTLFNNPVKHQDRSLTNIPFMTGDAKLDLAVVDDLAAHGLMNLKGHRSVGGLRASLYNAMPFEGVQALVNELYRFEKEM